MADQRLSGRDDDRANISDTEYAALLAALSSSPSTQATVAALRASYSRRAWRLNPSIRLHYSAGEDILFAELTATLANRTEIFHSLLCVEFDGDDGNAMPAALCLEEFLKRPDSPAAGIARKLLGEKVWKRAHQLAEDKTEMSELVLLGTDDRRELVVTWQDFAILPTLAVGVRMVPGRLYAVLVDSTTGKVGATQEAALTADDKEYVASQIASVAVDLARSVYDEDALQGAVIGVELGGTVDHGSGLVEHYNKLDLSARWTNFDLSSAIRERSGVRSVVVNDAEALGQQEAWASEGRMPEMQAVLLLAEGIGGAVISGGRVDKRFPMEIGNLRIDPETGRICSCGKRGCVEATAGLGAILADISQILGSKTDLETAIEAAEVNCEVLEVFARAGRKLSEGIAACQVIFKPRTWLVFLPPELYSRRSAASGALLGELEEFRERIAYKSFTESVSIEQRLAGAEEGAHGAALSALDVFGAPVLSGATGASHKEG